MTSGPSENGFQVMFCMYLFVFTLVVFGLSEYLQKKPEYTGGLTWNGVQLTLQGFFGALITFETMKAAFFLACLQYESMVAQVLYRKIDFVDRMLEWLFIDFLGRPKNDFVLGIFTNEGPAWILVLVLWFFSLWAFARRRAWFESVGSTVILL